MKRESEQNRLVSKYLVKPIMYTREGDGIGCWHKKLSFKPFKCDMFRWNQMVPKDGSVDLGEERSKPFCKIHEKTFEKD